MSGQRLLSVEQLESRRLLAFNPTAAEQELIQLVNRFRTSPAAEYSRLISKVSPVTARDPAFQQELDFFKVNGDLLRSELQALSPVPPVGWSEGVKLFTGSHNNAMVQAKPPQQFHSDSLVRRQQLLANGVNLRFANGETISSENVFGFAKSAMHLFAGYVIDWGSGSGGMQNNRPHRSSLHNDDFERLGTTITSFGGQNFGPLVNTLVLANIEDPPVLVVGAVFEDKNSSKWYEAGEGIGGAKIVFSGASGSFTANGMSAGGYQIELPAGTYTATATAAGMKHPVVQNNIVVGNTNVLANLIYDPDAIPPDASEPNNSRGAATLLTGRDQTLTNRSIHLASDLDYYRLTPQSTGSLTVQMQFSHAAGNLDLRLLNAAGSIIATSSTTGNIESITAQVVRDAIYYVQAYSVGGAVNGLYSLVINAPEPTAGKANLDRATVSNSSPVAIIPVLANDTDADGDRSKLIPKLAANAPASFSLDALNRVVYTAPAGFSGYQRTSYTVTDDQGLVSSPGIIEVFVVNFAETTPWQNKAIAVDVNDDRLVTGLDALLIINEINDNGARQLPTGGDVSYLLGFLDTSGNGFVSGLDVLLVVNAINAAGSGEGEQIQAAERAARIQDEALGQLLAAGAFSDIEWKRLRKEKRGPA